MTDQKTIPVTQDTYDRVVKIKDDFQAKHNAKKSFDQVIADLLEGKK